MQLSNNKILITGGASGIGLGLTKRFAQEGNTIIVCGRRETLLHEAASQFPGVIAKQCDLSSASDREALLEWVRTEHPDLNVLINNAGIQQWMTLDDQSFFAKAQEETAINIEAVVHLSQLFLKLSDLKTIMNVSSGLAFAPLTKTPVYSATKAFVHSFTMSLRQLVKAKGIEVIEIIPPALNTDLGGKGIHDAAPPVSDFIDAIFTQLREGRSELTFGYSASVSQASRQEIDATFARMNQ
jgi:uncharacterized oxidoreductase